MKSFKEQSNLDEGPLVMDDLDMVDTLFKKIKEDMYKARRQKRFGKNWPTLQILAKLAGYGITKRVKRMVSRLDTILKNNG